MPSSLFNNPLPNTTVDLPTPSTHLSGYEREARDRKALKHYLELAAKGDEQAKLLLKCHPTWRLNGWWNRAHGDVIGEHLSQVAREREQQHGG